ncbi:DUF2268 domain-containing protein [Halalkalibacter oceani]|uniref:DUF2268 domain-containing protein n=1 Tax=Halalkalibacter oceani TaxID=1653776 RepID=A0A9X2DSI8_9BACI|nr:DUF2268 domain-containing protein [Halalkalibacter oceani]MCM3716244.1 DUF2268 domain-containing protein [Halalkalibacter oceani]
MGVVRTDRWLRMYAEQWKKADSVTEKVDVARKTLIKPLCDVFQTKDVHALQDHLLQAGLLQPDQPLSSQWLEREEPWRIVAEQYRALQRKWTGPEVKIYLLPIEERNRFLQDQLGGKMGLTLPEAVILFIHPAIEEEELRVLLTHEYHHCCRLSHTKVTEQEITLLESIVMEGLAEHAVKEEFGSGRTAVWTRYYDRSWSMEWFEKWLKPHLDLPNRKLHYRYLYGDKRSGIPLWLGYYFGFRLVATAWDEEATTSKLLPCPAEELLAKSEFHER